MHYTLKSNLSLNLNKETAAFKNPTIFEIPLYEYADELSRKRDKKNYLKMKLLEKKSIALKAEIELLSERHYSILERTQHLVNFSYAMHYRITKKNP